ncbi:MAG: peptide deformylase [Alphaproteobacteria bacterium]|nr:peptide deformylase [Alphaproteobacteria bacterium]
MAILKIAKMGHPVLRQPAQLVRDPKAPEIQRLIGDMLETLSDIGGIGLAAPQVHVPLRVVIFEVPAQRAGGDAQPMTCLINPVIEVISPTSTSEDWEGCLSVPGLVGRVLRPNHIRYAALDQHGLPISREAKGYHARVVLHECDHLDGFLYPMRMTDISKLIFRDEMRFWSTPPSTVDIDTKIDE